MDPLSAIASVAGIAAAAGEIIKILGPYVTAGKDAPKLAAQLSAEALATQAILSGLERLANEISTSNVTYASLIQVDQLIAVLTDGVLIFSDLETLLGTLPPPEPTSPGFRLWAPMQWVRKKGSLAAIYTRLQSFKLSISCILSILQSDSQSRAENYQHQLIATVERLLERDNSLSQRMLGLENAFSTMGTIRSSVQSLPGVANQQPQVGPPNRSSFHVSEFEEDLKTSRVYRRAKRDTMDYSMRSSIARTNAWSIFSGISLSNISEISVIALPLYSEDIANPQHYNFGHEVRQSATALSPTVYTRSIYHDCAEVELQMSQFEWFAEFQQQEDEELVELEDPLARLMAVFRQGIPLLLLFGQLDNSYSQRHWEHILSSDRTELTRKVAIFEFFQACVVHLGFKPNDCFTIADVMSSDTTSHVKVIRVVRLLLSNLAEAGLAAAVNLDSITQISQLSQIPALLAVDEFLRDERFYLTRLENLLEIADKIKAADALPIESTWRFFAPVRPLVDLQRRFLIKAEVTAQRQFPLQTWHSPFVEWSQQSKELYSAVISDEKDFKAVLRAALPSADNTDEDRKSLILGALAVLGLPSHRLDRYMALLQELAQHGLHVSTDIRVAMESVAQVKDRVDVAVTARELQDAEGALVRCLINPEPVREFGKMILFDNVEIIARNGQLMKTRLYLFNGGVLQVDPESPLKRFLNSRSRSTQESYPKPHLSVVRAIHRTSMERVRPVSRKGFVGCEIEWSDENRTSYLIFYCASTAKRSKWINELKRFQRGFGHVPAPRRYIREYNLVVLGAGGLGTSAPATQLMQSFFIDQYEPLIESSYRKQVVIDDEVALLDVLHAAEQEEYPAMREVYMRPGEGFMLVYSINSRASFEKVPTFMQQILRVKDKGMFPTVVVGNNCSLESAREVASHEGEELARSLGCIFIETDAKSGLNVDRSFNDLVREIRLYGQ